jgi:hypothetical protein
MASLRQPSALPVVGVVADGRTYRHLLYLLIAVPLGFVYSTLFTFGVAVGVALSVVLVGFVVLLATLMGARLAAGFERRLANALLGTRLLRPDDLADADGALGGVRKYTDARSTWAGLGFLSLKLWVSVLAFVPLFLLASALSLVAAPLRYPYTAEFGEVNGEPVTWAIDALPEALVALALGVVGVLIALHVANLVAYVARRMAVALLGRPEPGGPRATVPAREASTGGDGEADDENGGEADYENGGEADDESGGEADDESGGEADDERDERDGEAGFDFAADPAPADRRDDP